MTTDNLLVRALRSCEECVAAQSDIQINADAAQSYARSLNASAVAAACRPFKYPCIFDTLERECSFLALMRLLAFGTGFEHLLQEQPKHRTAKDVTQMGVIGLHMADNRMDTPAMNSFTHSDTVNVFGIDAHIECDSGIAGVTMSKPGPLADWLDKLKSAITTTGEALNSEESPSIGAYIVAFLRGSTSKGARPSAAKLVADLADNFPAFSDSGPAHGEQVMFLRKAQLLAADLYLRFGATQEEAIFDFEDAEDLGPDTGAYAIAQMRAAGVITCSESVTQLISDGSEVQCGEVERTLRAACALAVRDVAAELRVPAWKVSRYLQQQADQGKTAQLTIHKTKQTLAY
eukprot:TRINITY_DN46048_c0_g1_i1.p1 TRINITY_DN46048_c0_g1~~TRINITY_DN46048_c0_g1_i1.p1  ORF type:complete len:347 (+),score=36.15 TRINITY_DN46048_c0_g1_i1:135-1175(+)